ncbi:glycosyltransferase family 4 protein [Candidatus Woesearchaeota archaeon]|nr:glycosyltransferase family 4 protein [Candidatus Woesearchaeota archaeon]
MLMRICVVTEFCVPYYNGGGEIRYHEITKRLAERGHEVHLVCCRFKGAPKEETVDGVHIHHIGPVIADPPNRSIWNFLHYILACLFYLLYRLEYDIIDANTYIPLFPAVLAGKLKHKPVLATINIVIGDWSKDKYNPTIAQRVERFLFNLDFEHVLTVSNYAKQALIKDFGIECDISVIYNGVDLARIESIEAKPKTTELCFVGRDIWFKHVQDAIDAAVIAHESHPELVLKIIGQDVETKHEFIKSMGRLDYDQTISEIKSSSIMLMPSTKDTFGLVVIEAAACGVPSIVYDNSGPAELVTTHLQGIVVKPRDVKAMAKQIIGLLDDQKSLEILSKSNREAAEKFDWSEVAKKIEAEYGKMIRKI